MGGAGFDVETIGWTKTPSDDGKSAKELDLFSDLYKLHDLHKNHRAEGPKTIHLFSP